MLPLEEGTTMAATAAVLFAVAALGGATMAAQRLRGREAPSGTLAAIHGLAAAAALVVYALALLGANSAPASGVVAISLFVVAALGGATLLFGFHLRGRALPVWLVLVHGGIAVVAFVLLLVAVLGNGGGDGGTPGY
jgi:hypothetical protein